VINRRTLLAAALALPAQAQVPRGLKDIAAAKGFVFGCAAASYEFKDGDFAPALLREAAQIVPEYEMKRDVLEPQPGRYDFAALDQLAGFARRNGLSFRGTPLVWWHSNPAWLAPALKSRRDPRLMTGVITALLRRYPMASVDVVNEAIAEDGNGLRPSLWLDAFGPGYLDMAFHAARAAAPNTRLVYNDYGCEWGSGDRIRAAHLKLLDGLIKRNVPVDVLGLQGHLWAFRDRCDQKKLRDFLAEVRARGLGILVTELDVDDTGGPGDIAARDRGAADEARRFLDVVLDNPAAQGVIAWNLSDRYVDAPADWKLKLLNWRYRKTPYDAQMRRKPLWDAVAQAFANARARY
jgi:endo-1,4-beta-xylanase